MGGEEYFFDEINSKLFINDIETASKMLVKEYQELQQIYYKQSYSGIGNEIKSYENSYICLIQSYLYRLPIEILSSMKLRKDLLRPTSSNKRMIDSIFNMKISPKINFEKELPLIKLNNIDVTHTIEMISGVFNNFITKKVEILISTNHKLFFWDFLSRNTFPEEFIYYKRDRIVASFIGHVYLSKLLEICPNGNNNFIIKFPDNMQINEIEDGLEKYKETFQEYYNYGLLIALFIFNSFFIEEWSGEKGFQVNYEFNQDQLEVLGFNKFIKPLRLLATIEEPDMRIKSLNKLKETIGEFDNFIENLEKEWKNVQLEFFKSNQYVLDCLEWYNTRLIVYTKLVDYKTSLFNRIKLITKLKDNFPEY